MTLITDNTNILADALIRNAHSKLHKIAVSHPNSIAHIQTIMQDMQQDIISLRHSFLVEKHSSPEEIKFFKYFKPQLFALYRHAQLRLKIIQSTSKSLPQKNKKMLKRYLRKNIATLEEHAYLAAYLNSGREDKDKLYFSRNVKSHFPLEIYAAADITFYTMKDDSVSKIMAAELNIEYITSLRHKLKTKKKLMKKKSLSPIRWKGSVNEFVELCYSIYLIEKINTQQLTIAQFIKSFAQLFDFEVKDPYASIAAIKRRKKEYLTLLPKMSKALTEYIEKSME